MKIIRSRPTDMSESKEPYMMGDFHKAIHEGLAPGPALDRMNSRMLSTVATCVNELQQEFEPESLYLWLRTEFTKATSSSLFGTHDPFLTDPSLIDSLW